MSQETTDNFWTAWNNWQPAPPARLFYRLYHDEHGDLLFYSMEDLPGNYIEIDQKTFAASPSNVKVIDGKLKYLITTKTKKIVPGNNVGTACHPKDVCVVVDPEQSHVKWSYKTNENY